MEQGPLELSSQFFNSNDFVHELTTPELDFTNQFSEPEVHLLYILI